MSLGIILLINVLGSGRKVGGRVNHHRRNLPLIDFRLRKSRKIAERPPDTNHIIYTYKVISRFIYRDNKRYEDRIKWNDFN